MFRLIASLYGSVCNLTFRTLSADSVDVKFTILFFFFFFFFFLQKIDFHISCKLSPKETICMKCQSLYLVSGFNKNYFKMSSADFFHRKQSVKIPLQIRKY